MGRGFRVRVGLEGAKIQWSVHCQGEEKKPGGMETAVLNWMILGLGLRFGLF